MANVITRAPTHRSAIARETMKELPILRSRRSDQIATQTSRLPNTDITMMAPRKKAKKIFIYRFDAEVGVVV